MQTVRWQTQQLHNKIMQDKSLNLSNNSAFNSRTVPLLCSYEMIFSLKSETCSSVTWSEWRGCVGGLEIAWVGFWQFDSRGHSALLSSFFFGLCCWEFSGNLFPPSAQSCGSALGIRRWTAVCFPPPLEDGMFLLPQKKKPDYFCSTHFLTPNPK